MLFGSSGIRQQYAKPLLELGPLVGAAVADFINGKSVTVATDTRTSNYSLSQAIITGLLAGGSTINFGGIAPTPAVATAKADAGIMITASHNPERYNGYKLFRPDGSSFTLDEQAEIETRIASPKYTKWNNQGVFNPVDLNTPLIDKISNEISYIENPMTAVVDCGNGAGCMVTPKALEMLGVTTKQINCEPSGHFNHPSEPLKENLLHIPKQIKKLHADCAVVNDGDADRMMAFDNKGRYIDGDCMLALFAQYLNAKTVVTTVDASMAIEECCNKVIRTPVGDSFVSERLIKEGNFGGEPSGAWIFPKHSLCPDGPYAAALFVKMASELNIAEEINRLPKYPILRDSIITDMAKQIVLHLGAENPTDGIRIAEDDGWFLIRASGTEPKVRCTAEGKTKDIVNKMLDTCMNMIKKAERELKCSV